MLEVTAKPSRIYHAGGLLTERQWAGHVTPTRRGPADTKRNRVYAALARTAAIYGTAAMVIETSEES